MTPEQENELNEQLIKYESENKSKERAVCEAWLIANGGGKYE